MCGGGEPNIRKRRIHCHVNPVRSFSAASGADWRWEGELWEVSDRQEGTADSSDHPERSLMLQNLPFCPFVLFGLAAVSCVALQSGLVSSPHPSLF